MDRCAPLMFLFLLGTAIPSIFPQTIRLPMTTKQSVPTVNIAGVIGGAVDLPCEISPPLPQDRVLLVLWYRDGVNTPVYSYDARQHPLRNVEDRHWASKPSGQFSSIMSRFSLTSLRTTDAGIYRCRVDFKMSPTRNARVNLTVIVPPQTVKITDESGMDVRGTAGPFNENGVLVLHCEAIGGQPPPKLTWWRENRLVDATSERVVQGHVRNTLRLTNLVRSNLGMNLTCQASNNNISLPISAGVTLDMRLRPLGVKRVNEDNVQGFSIDRDYDFQCISWGARPPAFISWWKGSTRLQSSKQSVSADGNQTTSVLTYAPSSDDQDKVLSCRVEHPLLRQKDMEVGWKLTIQYVPVAHLELGHSLRYEDIKEGDDLYLECNVQAVPPFTRLFWRHNGKLIQPNSSWSGGPIIITNNQTLIIQRIDRRWTGLFTCVASNVEGDGESNALAVNIKFLPECKFADRITTYYASKGELIQVPCEVDASPVDLIFHWTFNGSRSLASNIPGSNYVTDQLKSLLSYRPTSDEDFGTLMCWARNVAGEQSQPCVFQVLPVNKPDSLMDCTASNVSTDFIHISCRAGFDGGVSQYFHIQVIDSFGTAVVRNRTSYLPSFPVHDLEPNRNYTVSVWAENSKGRSEPQVLQVTTLQFPTSRLVTSSSMVDSMASTPPPSTSSSLDPAALGSIIGSVLGIASPLILAIIIIALILRLQRNHRGFHDGRHDGETKARAPLHQEPRPYDPWDNQKRRDKEEDVGDMTTETMLPSISNSEKLPSTPLSRNGSMTKLGHGKMNQNGSSNSTSSSAQQSGYVRLPLVDQFPLLPHAEETMSLSTLPLMSNNSAQNQLIEQQDVSADGIRKQMRIVSPGMNSSRSCREDSDLLYNSPILGGVQSSSYHVVDKAEPTMDQPSCWLATTRF